MPVTIPEAVVTVLRQNNRPMTIPEITKAIEDTGFYRFNSNDPQRMVRNAIEMHLEDAHGPRKTSSDYFRKVGDNQYELIDRTPVASDISEPPARQQQVIYRILRDTDLARQVKAMHNYECQICGHTIHLPDGSRYAEAHHVRPLGRDGLDAMDNIVCVCPNHHAELDYGASQLSTKDLRTVSGHSVNETYIRYHNEVICGRGAQQTDESSSARRAGIT
jgi:predicted restriction endonuclease